MNAQSNLGEDNGAKSLAPTRLNQGMPLTDILAQLKRDLRTPLNAFMDFTKQLETRSDSGTTPNNAKQILKATQNSIDIINRQVSEIDAVHPTLVTTVNPHCDVLHIEDDATSFTSVKLLLGNTRKLKVVRAINGENGIALAQAYAPRLILLDLDLPDFHGSEVIQRLQKEPATAGIPIVVISGDTTPSQIERLLVLGARNYLTKPLNPKVFLAVIDGILEPPPPGSKSEIRSSKSETNSNQQRTK